MGSLSDLLSLIDQYINDIEKAVSVLSKNAKRFDFYHELRSGQISSGIYFQFHGTGCFFKDDKLEIDFDFPDFTEGVVAIDLYFLIDYWKRNDSLDSFLDEKELVKVFLELDNPSQLHNKKIFDIDFSFNLFDIDQC